MTEYVFWGFILGLVIVSLLVITPIILLTVRSLKPRVGVTTPTTGQKWYQKRINGIILLFIGSVIFILVSPWLLGIPRWIATIVVGATIAFATAYYVGGKHVWKEGSGVYTKMAFYAITVLVMFGGVLLLIIGAENFSTLMQLILGGARENTRVLLETPRDNYIKTFTTEIIVLIVGVILIIIGIAFKEGEKKK